MQQKDTQILVSSWNVQQIKFPKTDEEIEEWSKKYPDVANIVDTIARKRASEALEEGEKRMESLKQLERNLTVRKQSSNC